MKPRKLILLIASIVIIVAAAIVSWIWLLPHRFRLDSQFYGRSEITEINIDTLKEHINEHQSFALLVYQPACRTSEDFEHIVADFSQSEQISFYKISFSTLKSSALIPDLKYYPSMVLYHQGSVKTFLHADQDNDTKAFLSYDGFIDWWNHYILPSNP